MKSFYIKVSLIFLVTTFLTWVLLVSVPYSYISVKDQPKGTSILVEEVRLAKPGFIIVQALDPATQLPGKTGFINNVSYLPKGSYKNINLYLGNQGPSPQTRAVVTLYEDTNENQDFDDYFDADENNPIPEGGFDQPVVSKIGGKLLRKFISLY